MTTDRLIRQRPLGHRFSFGAVFLTLILPFFLQFFLLSQTTVLSAESLAADRLAAASNFSTTTELLSDPSDTLR